MGIAAIEVFIPEKRLSVKQIAEESGLTMPMLQKKQFTEKPIHDIDEKIYAMGVAAARKLLQSTKINLNELEMLVYASTGVHDRSFWSPATKMQQELGLKDCFCFDINSGCHAGNYALSLVTNHLNVLTAKRYGLIIVCDALSRVVDHSQAEHLSIFNFSDAASAILIDKLSPSHKVISQFSTSDGRFSDYLWLGDNGKVSYRDLSMRNELKLAYEENYAKVISLAVRNAGRNLNEIKFIAISQGDPQFFEVLAKRLELPVEKIIRTSEQHGHMGGSDIFYGFKKIIAENKLEGGDLVVLASSAIGFSWGATLIEI